MNEEILKTIALEGGSSYTFDPDDPGGETKYGISKRAFPDENIKALGEDRAVQLYQDHYWRPLRLDQYQNIQYRWKLFDIGVNQGVATAQTFASHVVHPDTSHGVCELVEQQMKRYVGIVIQKPQMLKYLRGWANRAFETGEDLL